MTSCPAKRRDQRRRLELRSGRGNLIDALTTALYIKVLLTTAKLYYLHSLRNTPPSSKAAYVVTLESCFAATRRPRCGTPHAGTARPSSRRDKFWSTL